MSVYALLLEGLLLHGYLGVALHLVIGTVFGRWYVTLFGLTFLWRATRQLGWRRTVAYVGIALVVGVLAENGSVHLGFPYTRYAFNDALRHDELFIFDVPLMVPLSYTFMAYFAFAAGRLLASGPFRTRAPRAWHELVLAWMLAVWALWVLDPVSRLGDRFYLGELFHYRGPGFWFGLPLGSQVGFAATAAILIGVLYMLDRDAPDAAVESGIRTHPHLVALVTYHAQVFHLAIVAFVLGADTLGGAAVLIWVPAAVVTAVHWSQLASRVGGSADISASTGRRSQGSTTKAHSQCVEEEDAASGGQGRRNAGMTSDSGH